MPRKPREEEPGGYFHVTTRGNNRRCIFVDDRDRRLLLRDVARVSEELDWRCLALCLMPNHIHLVVRTMQANLSAGMKAIKERHAVRLNERLDESGHVFEGRYYAGPIRTDSHLRHAIRYVVQNPVRAGLCGRAGDWKWGSHAILLGGEESPLLAVPDLLAVFDADDSRRARWVYEEFCEPPESTGELVPFRKSLRWQRFERPPVAALLSPEPTDDELAEAFYRHGYPLRQIAAAVPCDYSFLSRRLERWRKQQGV